MREDYESTDLEGAARFERERAIAAGEDDRPTRAEVEDPPRECTTCGESMRYDGGIRAWGLLFCSEECADDYEDERDTYGEDPLGGAW